jgi:hypothetical protein
VGAGDAQHEVVGDGEILSRLDMVYVVDLAWTYDSG